ncbi:phosphoinositide phosphatase SAC2 [Gossypium raimondii]|uniref:Uncharacterized protein n=1 Tax=Gossypium raimondii TaxID=29730 RepID=A0A0D2T3F2_GOSRA|nr:phosphoinositide phosphatase SAC2 [Gossypium raimondii]KJB70243.1 hypothetical protein B456_011G118500 [Gossypium raimondii]
MVFYFKARAEAGNYIIFMGLDKYKNAELIKYGFIEDIWYKKLLSSVDLTKDFFFSYSYNVMCSLQKKLYNNEPGEVLYETRSFKLLLIARRSRHYEPAKR